MGNKKIPNRYLCTILYEINLCNQAWDITLQDENIYGIQFSDVTTWLRLVNFTQFNIGRFLFLNFII